MLAYVRRHGPRRENSEKYAHSRITYGMYSLSAVTSKGAHYSPAMRLPRRHNPWSPADLVPYKRDRIRDIRLFSYIYDGGGANQGGGPTAPSRSGDAGSGGEWMWGRRLFSTQPLAGGPSAS